MGAVVKGFYHLRSIVRWYMVCMQTLMYLVDGSESGKRAGHCSIQRERRGSVRRVAPCVCCRTGMYIPHFVDIIWSTSGISSGTG